MYKYIHYRSDMASDGETYCNGGVHLESLRHIYHVLDSEVRLHVSYLSLPGPLKGCPCFPGEPIIDRSRPTMQIPTTATEKAFISPPAFPPIWINIPQVNLMPGESPWLEERCQ